MSAVTDQNILTALAGEGVVGLGHEGEGRVRGRKHRDTDNSMVTARGEGVEEGNGGMQGGGKRLSFGS